MRPPFKLRSSHLAIPGLFLTLLITLALYWPGLSGHFLFDDRPNLAELGNYGGIQNAAQFWSFVVGGTSGPLGRPLALASFVLNDLTWPADPWPFKYTNLMLHLLTGLLVAWLALRWLRLLAVPEHAAALLAILTAALWLLHPLNVSTVLFVVQRMTILSALFTLAGLLAYLHGRLIVANRLWAGYAWMSLGIGLGGILATLSKENGILLPLYALVIEWTLIRPGGVTVHTPHPGPPPQGGRESGETTSGGAPPPLVGGGWGEGSKRLPGGYPPPRGWRLWASGFLLLPLLALLFYILKGWNGILNTYAHLRNFTLGERLLTEARILLDYLQRIALPRLQGSGLYHDDFPISHSLLEPPTTMVALIALTALLVGAMALYRTRWRIWTFAAGWFFGGHLLESTVLPLELYFEHRNYLPMIGPLFAVIYSLWLLPQRMQRLAFTVAILLTGGFAGMTWQNAQLWGNPLWLAETWAAENPTSVRAQQNAASAQDQWGDPAKAQPYLERAVALDPEDTGNRIQLLLLACQQGRFRAALAEHWSPLQTGAMSNAALNGATALVRACMNHRCQNSADAADLQRLLSALLDNPRFRRLPTALGYLYYEQGRLYHFAGELDSALAALDQSVRYKADPNIPLLQAAWLTGAQRYQEALQYVDQARQVDQRQPWPRRGLRQGDIERFDQLLRSLTSASSEFTESSTPAE